MLLTAKVMLAFDFRIIMFAAKVIALNEMIRPCFQVEYVFGGAPCSTLVLTFVSEE